MSDKLQTVELAKIELHPLNRKRLGNMSELEADIRQNGIEVPLIGRWLNSEQTRAFDPKHTDGSHAFQVLAGARRIAIARKLELPDVVVIVREGLSDEEAFRFLMRENLHREDVHPLDEALYFDQCITNGADVDMIAAEIGKEPAYVHRRLQLTQLYPAAAKAYEKGSFGAGVAMEVARIPEAAQKEAMKWILDRTQFEGGSVSVLEVKRWIRNTHVLLLSKACFSPKDPDLWPAAGSCVDCPKRTGATPSLFQDLADKDSCTDRKCWEQKAMKCIEQRMAEFEAQKVEWWPLGDWYYDPSAATQFQNKAIVNGNAWDECRQKDAGAVRGLLVRTRDLADLGKCLWVKARARSSGVSLTAQDKATRARQQRLEKVRGLYRSLVFDAIREAPPPIKGSSSTSTNSFLQRVAIAFWNRLWSESQKAIAKAYGWELVKQRTYNGWDMERTGHERIQQMRPGELVKFLEVLTLGHTVVLHGREGEREDELLEHAKRIGVDVAKLKRQAEDKFPSVKLAKKKAAKKKARQKARQRAGA